MGRKTDLAFAIRFSDMTNRNPMAIVIALRDFRLLWIGREVAKELRGEDTFHINPVGVFFGEPDKTIPDPFFGSEGPDGTGCRLCGVCMIGCPNGAKNTLDLNYLILAEKRGAPIFPETEVTGVRPLPDGRYEIIARSSHGMVRSKKVFTAGGVVFSGGVLGTLDLLYQCKQSGLLPDISSRLGNLTRTNSEAILAVDSRDRTKNMSKIPPKVRE